MKYALSLFAALLVAGCAGKLDYVRPTTQANTTNNTKVIERPRETVWNNSVPELGKKFFVINNLDKSSGLINVSYSGDPESYVDCGRITSYVKNARGERTYDFPGSKAQQSYEIMNARGLFGIERKMSLEGRVNLIFEEIGANQTRVTANTRYVINRNISVRHGTNNFPQSQSDSVSFNSGSSVAFPSDSDGKATECVSTGKLESDILSAIK